MENQTLWWGYLHTSGSLHLKRYFSNEDINEAFESPFVQKVTLEPFEAEDSEKAKQILQIKIYGTNP